MFCQEQCIENGFVSINERSGSCMNWCISYEYVYVFCPMKKNLRDGPIFLRARSASTQQFDTALQIEKRCFSVWK